MISITAKTTEEKDNPQKNKISHTTQMIILKPNRDLTETSLSHTRKRKAVPKKGEEARQVVLPGFCCC